MRLCSRLAPAIAKISPRKSSCFWLEARSERASSQKHELFRGEIFAMAGASREHNLIVANLVAELRNALRDRPCEVYPSDLRVKVSATGLYTYPDASIACDHPE